jgi:hypothetical protein
MAKSVRNVSLPQAYNTMIVVAERRATFHKKLPFLCSNKHPQSSSEFSLPENEQILAPSEWF